jgi:hypothetical protein
VRQARALGSPRPGLLNLALVAWMFHGFGGK